MHALQYESQVSVEPINPSLCFIAILHVVYSLDNVFASSKSLVVFHAFTVSVDFVKRPSFLSNRRVENILFRVAEMEKSIH